MSLDTFNIERADDDATVIATINRPDKMNAMDRAFFHDLIGLMDYCDSEPVVDTCIITGAGRAFSAGGDFATFQELTTISAIRRHLRLVYDAFHSLERAEVTVIAAVNGVAFGGGCEITIASDFAIASTNARFAFKEATVGLMPGYGVIRGPEIIGKRWTRRLAMTGEEIDARTALGIDLVQEVTEPDDLLDAARALAARIRENAPWGVRLAKQFINRDQGAPGIAESIEATALLFLTDDHRERVSEFFEGREN
ncbi:MAG: enoyl-CoA hydratase/isomerase family protein [bacterium]|nr:enoyl-CoA hydratase/isomerase family protein [bacterium]